MAHAFRIETDRLVLRDWRGEDIEPMFRMRSDPRVMATLGPLQSLAQVRRSFQRQQELQNRLGYCSWIVTLKDELETIGTTGFQPVAPGTPAGDAIEIGWKFRHEYWGRGYAIEAASAALAWWFAQGPGGPVYAITARINDRSRRLMDKLAMVRRNDDDFMHPGVQRDSPLAPHVLYVKEPPE